MTLLSFGNSGTDVGNLQQALVEQGYTIAPDELTTEKFGISTTVAVKAFQQSRKLLVDGVVGPATLAALQKNDPKLGYIVAGWRGEPSAVRAAIRPAVEAAISQIGQYEIPDGSNQVASNRYGNGSDPWCAYFCSWAYGRIDGGSPFGVLASAYKIYEWGQANKAIVATAEPGDIFVILRGNFHGHVGLVVNLLATGSFCCVEGNASNAVRGTIRNKAGVTALVRPVPIR